MPASADACLSMNAFNFGSLISLYKTLFFLYFICEANSDSVHILAFISVREISCTYSERFFVFGCFFSLHILATLGKTVDPKPTKNNVVVLCTQIWRFHVFCVLYEWKVRWHPKTVESQWTSPLWLFVCF